MKFISIINYVPEDCGEVNSGELQTDPTQQNLPIREIWERWRRHIPINDQFRNLDVGREIDLENEDVPQPRYDVDEMEVINELNSIPFNSRKQANERAPSGERVSEELTKQANEPEVAKE